MEDLLLFPEVDEDKAKKLAKKLLIDYKRWRQVLNDYDGQKITQELTFMPRGGGNGPSRPVENLAIKRLDALARVEAVEKAISNILNENYRYILIEKYTKNYRVSNKMISDHLGYENTQIWEMHNMALMAFMEAYENGKYLPLKNG